MNILNKKKSNFIIDYFALCFHLLMAGFLPYILILIVEHWSNNIFFLNLHVSISLFKTIITTFQINDLLEFFCDWIAFLITIFLKLKTLIITSTNYSVIIFFYIFNIIYKSILNITYIINTILTNLIFLKSFMISFHLSDLIDIFFNIITIFTLMCTIVWNFIISTINFIKEIADVIFQITYALILQKKTTANPLILIIIIPFIGFSYIFFTENILYKPKKTPKYFNCILMLLTFLITLQSFYKLNKENWVYSYQNQAGNSNYIYKSMMHFYNDINYSYTESQTIFFGYFFKIIPFEIKWEFFFDELTLLMLCLVTFVSTIVHFYSIDYMQKDPQKNKFMSYLSLFTFFMIILVSAKNLFVLFVGWEGVGLCSYLLINFWYRRIEANKAALKALIMNKVGDCALILGILLLLIKFQTIDLLELHKLYTISSSTVNIITHNYNLFANIQITDYTLISLCLLIGSIGKSAQIGLHTWLPDAMEGPTPVSALIHAATMVTAGIYLILRYSFIFEKTPQILLLMTFIGAITAFFSAMIALTQNDLKKVIAYSTCSQLGYMMLTCGLSNYKLSFFHLINHGIFKALLFLTAGLIIHAMQEEQDIRKLGGLHKLLPISFSFMVIGSLSLMGFPFLTGYYSKDLILEFIYILKLTTTHFNQYYNNLILEWPILFIYWLATLTAFLTAFYSWRLIYLIFITKTNTFKSYIKYCHEANKFLVFILSFLVFGSIFFGYFFKNNFYFFIPSKHFLYMTQEQTWFYKTFLYIKPYIIDYYLYNLSFLIKQIPFIGSFIGLILGILLPQKFILKQKPNYLFYFKKILLKKFYIDKFYNKIGESILWCGFNITFKLFDKGLFELIGPYGFNKIIMYISKYYNIITFFLTKNFYRLFIFLFTCILWINFIFFLY